MRIIISPAKKMNEDDNTLQYHDLPVLLAYVQQHLRILSGFYGVLKPMDGVTPYRLEMQAKAHVDKKEGLYDFWGKKLYDEVMDSSRVTINLASKEYAKCIETYLQPEDRWITCIFGELSGGKIVQKGVYAKMARGEMVRFLAENQIEEPEEMQRFVRLGYRFRQELSTEKQYVFIKEPAGNEQKNKLPSIDGNSF